MARQKNSTALFDAIYSAKKPPKASPSAAIPTPKWWGKNKTLPKPAAVESTENVGKQKSWLSNAKKTVAAPAIAPMPLPAVTEQPAVAYSAPLMEEEIPALNSVQSEPEAVPAPVEPKPRFIDRFKKHAPEPTTSNEEVDPIEITSISELPAEEIILPTRTAKPPEQRESFIRVDRITRDIRFSLSYWGLVAIGCIFVMALAIAFIAGKQASLQASDDSGITPPKDTTPAHTSGMMAAVGPTAPAPENPVSSEPVKPDVLSIPSHTQRAAAVVDASAPTAAPLPIKSTREIGMIYVVVQSYPEHDLAQRACDYMNRAGIPCTLVQGPSDWALSDWYSVIGLQPFKKHDPALPEYERAVKALGVKFTNLIPDQFQPQAYTWREDSDLSQR